MLGILTLFSIGYCMWPLSNKEKYLVWSHTYNNSLCSQTFYLPQDSDCLSIFFLWIFCGPSNISCLLLLFIVCLNFLLSVFFLFFWGGAKFLTCAHHILVRPEDSSSDDSQEQADHIEHHWGPQQTVQVDHIPAAADPSELIVLCVVVCAGREQWSSTVMSCSGWPGPPYFFSYYCHKWEQQRSFDYTLLNLPNRKLSANN